MGGKQKVIFLCVQAILYGTFLVLDLLETAAGWSTALKYLSILLCFAFVCVQAWEPDVRLVCAALGLTALADLFLLVLGTGYLAGVCVFCGAQALYGLRLARLRGGEARRTLLLRGALAAAGLAALALLDGLSSLTAVTGVYFALLLSNALESLALGRRTALFSVGLLLFLCCDLCVGAQNLSLAFPATGPGGLYAFTRVGMWLFYLPSQVLITLSAGKK